MSAKGSAAARPATASWNAPSMSSSDSREHDRAAVHLGVEAGLGRELGQPVDRDVHLHRAAARSSSARCARRSRSGSSARSMCSQERDLRMRRGDHDVGAQLLARLERRRRARARCARRCARPARRCARSRRWRSRRRAAPGSPRPCRLRGSPTSRAGPSPTSPILWCAITYAVPGRARPGPRADDAAHRRARPASAATRSTRRAGRRCSS